MNATVRRNRLSWYWNRLRCMRPAEVAWQFRRLLRNRLGHSLRSVASDRVPSSVCWVQPPSTGVAVADYVREAERIGTGEIRMFRGDHFVVDMPIQWNRCPRSGLDTSGLPSHRVDTKDRFKVGNIKLIWELNRHLHWVTLAQAYALNGDQKHLEVLAGQLESWLDQCPPGMGPNWASVHEHGLRLVNWSVVWQLIGGSGAPIFEDAAGKRLLGRWLASVRTQVLCIVADYSRYSSANNHLIGELTGVYLASRTWPCWPDVRRHGDAALRGLEREIRLQTTLDGANREQAFGYLSTVFDMFVCAERCARVHGEQVSEGYLDRLAGMCTFVRSLMARGGEVPRVGDSDSGQLLRLSPLSDASEHEVMLHLGALLFDRPEWVLDLSNGREEALWLVGQDAVAATRREPALSCPEGGYELFQADAGLPTEIKGFVDVGPLGYLDIAAHGHADALQLCLAVGGQPVLVDPGTFSYWQDPHLRAYFRGTSAHNTARVGGCDQSQSGGPFMWVQKAQVMHVQVTRSADGSMDLVAEHDGYRRLPSRFRHARRVRFEPTCSRLVVEDELSGMMSDLLEIHWHFHPDVVVERCEDGVEIQTPARRLRLSIECEGVPASVELLRGIESPPLGWYSRRYGHREPALVLRWQSRASHARVLTRIEWD